MPVLRLLLIHDSPTIMADAEMRGGTAIVLLTLMRGFKRAGHEVEMVVNKRRAFDGAKDYFGEKVDPDFIQEIDIKSRTAYGNISLSKKLAKSFHPEAVIQTRGHPSLTYGFRCPKYFYAQSWRLTPLTKRIQSYPITRRILYLPFMLIYRNEGKDVRFVTCSLWVKHNLEKNWETNAEVIYPPVRVQEVLPLAAKEKVEGKIVSLGKFTGVKNLPDQIRILKLLHDDGVNASLSMIGGAMRDTERVLEKIKSLTRRHDVDSYVKINVNASRKEILSELASSQILLHTCTREAFGIAPVEGMAAGCIPCVPNKGGLRETVPSEFRFDNLQQAKEIIKKSILQSTDNSRFIEISKKYSEERFIEGWVNALKEKT